MATGLTISTLHSHHDLEWHHHHPEDFADTGNCISTNTTPCPICGYIFKTDLPSNTSSGIIRFSSEELTIEGYFDPISVFEVVNKGRSPPVFG
ncbi:hypothetical protein ACG2F4_03785 [Halalkalibaculum sp. DA3122]|uniref:hypothetical protein n=1 Tax=Halalkalibaculum sp. DA3122 TaxID=3373607 RepID=UPI003754CE7A